MTNRLKDELCLIGSSTCHLLAVLHRHIAEELNRLGVLSPMAYKESRGLPHPTGGFADVPDAKWFARAVIRILQEETYTGVLLQGRQKTHNHKLKNIIHKPAEEWVRIENAHEPIIQKQDFDLVQKISSLDTRTAPDGDAVYLFSGLLVCGCCGGRMTRKLNDKLNSAEQTPVGKAILTHWRNFITDNL